MHYKYASSEAPAPRRLWYKEFTPELQQTATLVADDVPLGEAAEAVDELQQKYNCTLIFKASSNERPPVDVQAHLSPKGRALTDLKESGVCAGKHHLAKGSFSSVDLIRRLGKGNCGKSQYLLLSRLVCNAISRACTTSGPHMCTFEVHVFVERPLVEDGAQRKHYQRQLARGLVGPDYEYQRTAFAKCTIVMYGKHSPGSTYTSSLASAGYAARAVVDEALHGGVIGAGRVHARPMDVHTMTLTLTLTLSKIGERFEHQYEGEDLRKSKRTIARKVSGVWLALTFQVSLGWLKLTVITCEPRSSGWWADFGPLSLLGLVLALNQPLRRHVPWVTGFDRIILYLFHHLPFTIYPYLFGFPLFLRAYWADNTVFSTL
jgi:hypothetical protein